MKTAARHFLARTPAVLEAVEMLQMASEALTKHREQPQPNDEEDRAFERERITAREKLIAAVENATGATLSET